MEPIDYLTMRFTGVASATHASRLAMWMTDNRHLGDYRYDAQLLSLVGLDEKYLPPLQAFGSIVGTLSEHVAAELGLSKDVVVVTAIPDLHAAAIGAGATSLYETHLALSTTSWISCPVPKKKTDVNHNIAAVPGLSNDSYVIIDNQETAAKALEWLQGVMAGSGTKLTFARTRRPRRHVAPGCERRATSPRGSRGSAPRSTTSTFARGLPNLSITTTSADLVRSVMEGVAANSSWLFGYVEKFAGRTLSPIRMVGGGAQSSLWCQIFADTLNREVHQIDQPLLAQLRGAALLAGPALGSSFPQGRPDPKSTVFEPSGDEGATREQRDDLKSLYERDKAWSRRRRERRDSRSRRRCRARQIKSVSWKPLSLSPLHLEDLRFSSLPPPNSRSFSREMYWSTFVRPPRIPSTTSSIAGSGRMATIRQSCRCASALRPPGSFEAWRVSRSARAVPSPSVMRSLSIVASGAYADAIVTPADSVMAKPSVADI